MGKFLKREVKNIDYLKLAKYAAGAVAAVLVCGFLRLEYAYSAGIITMLTIQDTKKETVWVTLKRLAVFVMMTLLSAGIFSALGYHVWAFGVLLVPYLFLCLLLDMKEAVVPVAVLCTHYLSSKSCGFSMIGNEFLLLMIGAGIGVFLNLFMPDLTPRLKQYRQSVDDKIVSIVRRMAVYIEKEDKTGYNDECFAALEKMLAELKSAALRYMNNHFLEEKDYYYGYMQMRLRQCNILKHIYADIVRIGRVPKQAEPLAAFLRRIADEFHENNDAEELLLCLNELEENYSEEELPASRQEFENRAILYHILKDLEIFLEIKREFSAGFPAADKELGKR